MADPMRREWRPWLAMLIIACAMLPVWPARSAALSVSMTQLGHVYAPGEEIDAEVSGAGADAIWSVTDMFGQTQQTAVLASRDGHGTIALKPAQQGWFKLSLRDDAGAAAETSFAVMEPPRAAPPTDRFAVMTHFAQAWDTDIVPLIARAGIGQVRDELYWQEVEKTKGVYALPERYTHYLAALADQRLKLLLVLSFANSLYDDGATPYTLSGRAGYADYAAYLAGSLGDRLSGVEIWNEFNGSFCKGPCEHDRPAAYADLLAATYPALKQARPDLPVGGGAAVLVPKPWFQALADHGAVGNLDALVVHPYRAEAEGIELALADLRAVARPAAAGVEARPAFAGVEARPAFAGVDARPAFAGGDKPIWATEYSHADRGPEGGANTARYLVRQAVIMLSEGVTRISWYLLRDYANFTTMGLLAGPDSPLGRYAPAPAYPAYAVLIRQLDGMAPQGREATDPRTRLYRFGTGPTQIWVGWSSQGATTLRLDTSAAVEEIDLMGNRSRLEPKAGEIDLNLGENPVYLIGNIRAFHETSRPALLADSVTGFTGTPDASADWSYGAFICPNPGAGDDDCLAAYGEPELQPLSWTPNQWEWAWRSPRFNSLKIAIDLAHPSAEKGHAVWAVRRWTAHRAGQVAISGVVDRPGGKGDGSDALILVDGKTVWRAALGRPGAPDRAAFAVQTSIRDGSKIDFIVTPGPAADIDNDATHFTAMICDAP